jgi:lipoprotein-anchoring transpeptidase ErfK/SrfK
VWITFLLIVFAIAIVKVYFSDDTPRKSLADLPKVNNTSSNPTSMLENPEQPPSDMRFSMNLPQQKPKQKILLESVPKLELPKVIEAQHQKADYQTNGLINNAVELIEANPPKIIAARDSLNQLLSTPLTDQQRKYVKDLLSNLSMKWLFSRTVFPDDKLCDTYKVVPGDRLIAIGKQYKVTYQFLMQINNIKKPQELRAGESIKIVDGPFHARIDRSSHTLDLYLKNIYVRSFSVGLGRTGRETPTGLWLVKPGGKMISPTWTDPETGKTYLADDPHYPLGSRWIGLIGKKGNAKDRSGFAMHGTKDRNSIGKNSSRGCIRMHDKDIILMYNLMMPGSSQLEVVD